MDGAPRPEHAAFHGFVICASAGSGQQKQQVEKLRRMRLEKICGPAPLRALLACLCAASLMISVVAGSGAAWARSFAPPAPSLVFANPGEAGPAKPCPRSGLQRTLSLCSAGIALGLAAPAPTVSRVPSQHRLGPVLRLARDRQCCGAPPLRPPRVDA